MVTKSDFVLDWDKALGFKSDPFADKIFVPINKFLVNRKDEKEKINWFFIKNYFYGAMVGEQGVGKTTLMKWLEDRLYKFNRIHGVYINAAVFKEQVNILHKMILPLLSFYERTISKPHTKLLSADFMAFLKKKLGHKSMALLIDNAQHLTDKNLELIKSLRKEKLKLRVIVTSTPKEYEKSRLAEIGTDELGITLRRLTFKEAEEMVKCRIEAFGGKGIYPFSEEELKKMYEKADKNPREFIKLCRDGAIKILIHKREQLEKKASLEAHEAKPLKTPSKKDKPSDRKLDIKIRKATEKEEKEEKEEENKEKKKGIRIRFAFGKNAEKSKKHKHLGHFSSKEQRKAIHDEHHKQKLLNQMTSTSPRRKGKEIKEEPRDESSISETDKLLKELAEEFEVD